jgi:DNA-binding GntR family transcriptional regulator
MAEEVYRVLKNAIIHGDLSPGQRLIEQKLSDKMQVSRAPVREAIKKLEQYGFVVRLPERGAVVKKISEGDIEEALGIRAALESYAAARACGNVCNDLIAALEESIKASLKALKEGDLTTVIELDARFHQMIYEMAKSDVLSNLINIFTDYIARYQKPMLISNAGAGDSLRSHNAMVEAMRRGDKENVERIMKSHILQGRDCI